VGTSRYVGRHTRAGRGWRGPVSGIAASLVVAAGLAATPLSASAAPVGAPGAVPTTLVTGPQPAATLVGPTTTLPSFDIAFTSMPCSDHTFNIDYQDGTTETQAACSIDADGIFSAGNLLDIGGTTYFVDSPLPIIPIPGGTWLALGCAGLDGGGCRLGTVAPPQLVTEPLADRNGRVGPAAKFAGATFFSFDNGATVVAQVGSIATSDNGKWLAVKTRGPDTLARVDVANRNVLPFAAAAFCCQGTDDRAPLAIDPSGQFVAQGRLLWGDDPLTLWDLQPCVVPPAGSASLATGCASQNIQTLVGDPTFTPNHVLDMRWQTDGSLTFAATAETGGLEEWSMVPTIGRTAEVSLTATPEVREVGDHVVLLARVADAATGAPVPNTLVTFGVLSGPDSSSFAAVVATDSTGTAGAVMGAVAAGDDEAQAWLDTNSNGIRDGGEAAAFVKVTWTQPYVAFGDSITTGDSIAACQGVDDRAVSPWGCNAPRPPATPYPDRVASALGLTSSDSAAAYQSSLPWFPPFALDRVGIWGYTAREAREDQANGRNESGPWVPELSAVERASRLVTGGLGINDLRFSYAPNIISWFSEYKRDKATGKYVVADVKSKLAAMSADLDSVFNALDVAKQNGATVVITLYYNPYDTPQGACADLRDVAGYVINGTAARLGDI